LNFAVSSLPYTSDVEAISTLAPWRAASSSTSSVALMLVEIVCTGRSTISFTPTAAAM